jgi:creatinine amidohydrolase
MKTLSRLLPILLSTLVVAQTMVTAQTPVRPGRAGSSGASPDPNTPRVLDAVDSVFLEELTWLEVRDAMRAGKRTAIVATGGVEMNGPYLALGKHNYVLRATTEAIARQLGTRWSRRSCRSCPRVTSSRRPVTCAIRGRSA